MNQLLHTATFKVKWPKNFYNIPPDTDNRTIEQQLLAF